MIHPAALDPMQLIEQCRLERRRGSGPGGQRRNKVETAVRLVHEPTGVVAEASERRSQAENRKTALFRLRVNLAIRIRCPAGEAPSALWKERCRGAAVSINPHHDDYPAILAEALDLMAVGEYDPRHAAKVLNCTSSQLIKVLRLEPRALHLVNEQRRRFGVGALR